MLCLRITAPDGGVRDVPLGGPELTLGRAPDNAIVLDDSGISTHHCAFAVQGSQCMVQDRGSTNGTFVNSVRVQGSTPLAESDRIYLGQYLVQVVRRERPVHPGPAPGIPARDGGGRSPSLIQRGDRGWRDQYNRLRRYAQQWDQAGRPDRLALRPGERRQAEAWLAQTPAEQRDAITPLQRELIASSRGANARTALKRGLGVAGGVALLGGLVTAAVLVWPPSTAGEEEGDSDGAPEARLDLPREPSRPAETFARPEASPSTPRHERVDHEVVPEETLADIAQRYGVTVAQLAEWNLLNPDAADLEPGTTVVIKAPNRRPLPQQKIDYELERVDTSWTKLSKRFGVSAKKLRAYNPDVQALAPGQSVVIWVDPKPYAPKVPRQPIAEYVPTSTARAVGSPSAGRLENGVQLPESPLYKRRYPNIMWGSGYLVATVQTAVAQFRQDMDFDGTLVMADISKRKGGPFFPPHLSHQTGRDIDIWLPTLRGVFKEKYLTEDGEQKWGRRPNPEEVDWFATWGLIKALLDTERVQNIFLSESVQPRVYDAAKILGVSDEELDYALQWPRGQGRLQGKVIHSRGHSHHMHVRIQCAPWEKECQRKKTPTP